MNKEANLVYDYLNKEYGALQELPEMEAVQSLAHFANENNIQNWFEVDSELQPFELNVRWFWLVRRLRNNIHILRELQTPSSL